MKKMDIKNINTNLEAVLEKFDKLTYDYENKVPNTEINLDYNAAKAPENIQFFATDLGNLPHQGSLEDFEAYFKNAKKSMMENNIESKYVTFDFGGYGQDSGVKVKVFSDEKAARYVYLKEIKELHNITYDLQQEVNDNKAVYIKMHEEYKKAAPSAALDKAHNKLIKPLNDALKNVQDILTKIEVKIVEHQNIQYPKKKKPR